MEEKQENPKGLVWIEAILGLGIIGGVLSLILKKVIFTSIDFLKGTLWDVLIIFSIILMFLMIIGIRKRIAAFYIIILVWFGLDIVFSLISFFDHLFSLESANQIIYPIIKIALNSLFIWYLSRRKEYFVKGQSLVKLDVPLFKKQEKRFRKFLVLIFIVYIILMLIGPKTFELYKTVKVMKNIADKDVPTALQLCREKDPDDRDFCIFKIVEYNRRTYDFGDGEVCSEISDLKYRDGCFLLLTLCDKISDSNTGDACDSLVKFSESVEKNLG